ncbi:glycosyltransferase family 4 protein [Pontibacter sp. KCTC 32443]|uniref:glycosyltransferase family 4 protein n=1 Tax=Pontibacter TaxID=323449 RepID=UPI00164E7805|nr:MULTISPECIES: glycosyltransferase family 4 protein [Pontibacter]MBC5772979.1 glycosyltransferase family 4 protein [Pontibacter sp. KCTC 32443]
MTIGVCGPIDLKLLDWDLGYTALPETNSFPLTSHFINALLKRGYKVIGYTNSCHIDTPQVLESGNLKICISRAKPQPGRRFFSFEVEDLRKQIEAHPADFISAFWSYEFGWAALKTGIPTVVSLHDVASKILQNQPDMFRIVRWLMNQIVVSKAKYLIANSYYTYSILNKEERSKTLIINNFYTETIEQISQMVPGKGDYIVSVVQGFTKRKNIHKALYAFAKIREQFPDLSYHLVGVDMEEGGPAQKYAKKYKLDAGIIFIGPLPYTEVVKQIAGAKVLLHPSVEESFGMAILEAMVSGTAVVGGRKSGFVPYLLNHGNAGILCDITSSDDIALAVIKLLEDDSYRNKLSNTAKVYAQAHFSEEVVIKRHLDYYSKILGRELEPAEQIKKLTIHAEHNPLP